MLGASHHIANVFRHFPGVSMTLADALSRANKNKIYKDIVASHVQKENLLSPAPQLMIRLLLS